MRVLIAPDSFTGTLTAAEASAAIADGWTRQAPHDIVDQAPLSDGGPGFVAVLERSVGGSRLTQSVTGPTGAPVMASVLLHEGTAYIESAHACGLHLIADGDPGPGSRTSAGVGELMALALDAGARRIVVGLGGTGTTDAGAGMWATLGALPSGPLLCGGLGLGQVDQPVDLSAVQARLDGVDLVVATDVDVPLLGARGAARGFAAQKGATEEQIEALELALTQWAAHVGRRPDGRDAAVALGAGAGGGLGYGLIHLGATRVGGLDFVTQAIGFDARLAQADLVITGEGRFDWQSLRGKVVAGVAGQAQQRGIPTIVLTGESLVGRREFGAIGIEAAYAMSDHVGSVEQAMAQPSHHLADLAARVARTWSR